MTERLAGKIRWIESLKQLRALTLAEGPLGGAGGYCLPIMLTRVVARILSFRLLLLGFKAGAVNDFS
jgi:hypothetical protein